MRQNPQDVGVGIDKQIRADLGNQVMQDDAVGDAGGVVRNDQRRAVGRDMAEAAGRYLTRQHGAHFGHDAAGLHGFEPLCQGDGAAVS